MADSPDNRCRLCTTNDLDGLAEEIAAEMPANFTFFYAALISSLTRFSADRATSVSPAALGRSAPTNPGLSRLPVARRR